MNEGAPGIGRRKELELDELLRRVAYVADSMRAEWPLDDDDVRLFVAAQVVVADVVGDVAKALAAKGLLEA